MDVCPLSPFVARCGGCVLVQLIKHMSMGSVRDCKPDTRLTVFLRISLSDCLLKKICKLPFCAARQRGFLITSHILILISKILFLSLIILVQTHFLLELYCAFCRPDPWFISCVLAKLILSNKSMTSKWLPLGHILP